MEKTLADLPSIHSKQFKEIMIDLNKTASRLQLTQYTTYSRIWEYPWLWLRLAPYKQHNLRLLDIGSELSPFPWFLAENGFSVTISDCSTKYFRIWNKIIPLIRGHIKKRLLDAQLLALPSSCMDIYLSVSVFEHVPDKKKAIMEAARVIKPGGLLIMTFDICQTELEMTFPEWNGRAVSIEEIDQLLSNNGYFEPGIELLDWNKEFIDEYLAWHRKTAKHHNYVTGAAMLRRSEKPWIEPFYHRFRRQIQIAIKTATVYLNHYTSIIANVMKRFIAS